MELHQLWWFKFLTISCEEKDKFKVRNARLKLKFYYVDTRYSIYRDIVCSCFKFVLLPSDTTFSLTWVVER